jgi:GNAT superfamily N-acetyltransferase
MTEPTSVDIRPLDVPASLDAPGATAFREVVRIGNAAARFDAGHADLDEDPAEVLADWLDTADRWHDGWIARRGDEVVGVATMTGTTQAGTRTAEFFVSVEPELRGTGVEAPLLAAVEDAARARGLRSVQTWTLHRVDERGERLVPPTGAGSVPLDAQSALLRDAGFTLEQVERNSAFDLHGSFAAVDRLHADALARAGDAYRLMQWTGETPDEHQDGYAYTLSRMSTDAPAGGRDVDEQVWDAERVRRRDARMAAQGLFVSVVAAQHVGTGAIAAYNELVIGEDRAATTWQYGTLVVAAHRGHRLGALVKCEGLRRWREVVPESPRVTTFNAEENRHMLSINEELGFVATSHGGAWQKEL